MKRLMPSATVQYWLILCKCEQEIRSCRKLVEFVVERNLKMNRRNQVLAEFHSQWAYFTLKITLVPYR